MAFNTTKQELVQVPLAEVRRRYADKFWRVKRTRINNVPADQKFAVVALGLAPGATPADHDALIAALEAIVGVQAAKICVYGQTPSDAEMPADHTLSIGVAVDYDFVPDPEPE